MDFNSKYNELVEEVNKELDQLVKEKDTPEKNIYTAMKYSLMAGGKRLRPVLSLAVCEMLGGDKKNVMPFACAIEMIHTYSLIHDDLPAMDDDDYRRGRLTNHKVFGEAKAILAGDGLLNYAFEVILKHSLSNQGELANKVRSMYMIAQYAGVSGMIGGQVVDLESQSTKIPAELLEYMHKLKTGALIKASVMSAAVLCNAEEKDLRKLEIFSEKIGLAFQIKDDILDVEGKFEDMGKSSGSDEANNKSTFVTFHGLDKSKKILLEVLQDALSCIESFGEKGWFMKRITEYFVERNN